MFWQATAANPRGQVMQESLGNGIVTNRAFDSVTGWLGGVQSGAGGGAGVQNESYLFDLLGAVTQRQNGNAGLTENFYYDSLYRLEHSVLGSSTNLALTYDAMGNIKSRSDIAGRATWTYDASKKHALLQAGNSSLTYTYDQNGNANTRNGYSIVWSSSNYPTSINSNGKNVAFSYDPNRKRYAQVYTSGAGTESTIYVGDLLEKVTTGSTVDWRHYIRAAGQLVAIMSRQNSGANATHYILEDHEGSLAKITDGAGATTVSDSFSAFGTRRDPTTWSGACACPDLGTIKSISREGFTGQDAIGGASMGMNHMNGRVEDAITGRFLSPDPNIPNPGNTQSFNRYSYVNNNPLTFIDPTGFDLDCIGGTDGCLPDYVIHVHGTDGCGGCGGPGQSGREPPGGGHQDGGGRNGPPLLAASPIVLPKLEFPTIQPTLDMCKNLAQSLGFSPDFTAPASSPIDDTWSIGSGTTLAGSGTMALRGYVGVAGSRAIGGQSVARTMSELRTYTNILGGLGVGVSAYQAYDAYSSGDTLSGALSTLDAVAGVSTFFPGFDVAAVGYGISRILVDVGVAASSSKASVLERAATLQAAGCL